MGLNDSDLIRILKEGCLFPSLTRIDISDNKVGYSFSL